MRCTRNSYITKDITSCLKLFYYIYFYFFNNTEQAQEGKTKLFINCFRNPTSTCATEIWRKHNSGKQPTVDCTLEPIHRAGVKHSVGRSFHIRTWAGRKGPANLDVLHLDTSNSNRSAAAAARVCRTLVSRSRRKIAEQTVIKVRINLVQHA